MAMRRVIIESPYGKTVDGRQAGAIEIVRNVTYAQRAMAHSLSLGEAPYLSHLLYTQCLDDSDPVQRKQGIAAGRRWGDAAEVCAVYVDYGVTPGMKEGMKHHEQNRIGVAARSIGKNP
ncbi:MAG: hypothetical protein IMY75_13370 [Chloroflexi bacterium]|nr:hypothetical protein [Chloroflexota bacterium]